MDLKKSNGFYDGVVFAFGLLVSLLLVPFIWFRSLSAKSRDVRVIIFPQRRIGDFVAQTPLFREIKKALPCSRVTVCLINPALEGLMSCDPAVDEVIVWEKDISRAAQRELLGRLFRGRFDWCFNLSFESWVDYAAVLALIPRRVTMQAARMGLFLRLFYGLPGAYVRRYGCEVAYTTDIYLELLGLLGIHRVDRARRLYPCVSDQKRIEDFLRGCGVEAQRPLVGIGVSCGNRLKKWPEENFARLADELIARYGVRIIWTGDKNDREVSQRIRGMMRQGAVDACGVLSLGEFLALCPQLKLFISVDSGPLYVANAAGTAVVDIAGPIAVREQLLLTSRAKAVMADIACAPCSFVFNTQSDCRFGHRECVSKTSVEDVLTAAGELLA